ncbi:hypothetical protein REPUB_Repub16aG0066000 [Reevesia pubescens]
MHDLFHDLASAVEKNECSTINSFEQNAVHQGIRHLCVINPDSPMGNASKFFNKLGHVRTLRFPDMENGPSNKSFIETCLKRFQHLRMLDLTRSTLEALPETIGNLKHLRYLNLTDNLNIKKLPNSICKLQNLQTLALHDCHQIEELPKDMRYMISLRFLTLSTKQRVLPVLQHLKSLQFLALWKCDYLEYLFEGIEKLASLQTLLIGECKNLISLPHGLKYLTALRFLIIADCQKLDLNMTLGFEENEDDDNGFCLQTLGIVKLPKLEALPQWLLRGSANNLKHLSIKECQNLTTLPEWHNLTSLEKLEIIGCPKLSRLPQKMQRLKLLKIENSSNLSERCKRETGEDWPIIAHASGIYLDGNKISAEE